MLFKNVSQFSLGNTERLFLLNETLPVRIPGDKMSTFEALSSTDPCHCLLCPFSAIPSAWRHDNTLSFTKPAVWGPYESCPLIMV